MKLVVFAVVLILPAVLSAESGTQHISTCEGYLIQGGDAECGLLGTSYSTYDPKDCTVVCEDGQRPKLPKGVCLNGEVTCTPDVEQRLEGWNLQNQEDYITSH
uniref:Putative ixodes 10 kDa peptide protein n=1 Tax=Ixodes ricinus TaxID=34613 RepID=A0A0K8RDN0_IXORI